jgi:hypothetical protein
MRLDLRTLSASLLFLLLFFVLTSSAHHFAGNKAKEETRMCLDLPVVSLCVAEVDFGE